MACEFVPRTGTTVALSGFVGVHWLGSQPSWERDRLFDPGDAVALCVASAALLPRTEATNAKGARRERYEQASVAARSTKLSLRNLQLRRNRSPLRGGRRHGGLEEHDEDEGSVYTVDTADVEAGFPMRPSRGVARRGGYAPAGPSHAKAAQRQEKEQEDEGFCVTVPPSTPPQPATTTETTSTPASQGGELLAAVAAKQKADSSVVPASWGAHRVLSITPGGPKLPSRRATAKVPHAESRDRPGGARGALADSLSRPLASLHKFIAKISAEPELPGTGGLAGRKRQPVAPAARSRARKPRPRPGAKRRKARAGSKAQQQEPVSFAKATAATVAAVKQVIKREQALEQELAKASNDVDKAEQAKAAELEAALAAMRGRSRRRRPRRPLSQNSRRVMDAFNRRRKSSAARRRQEELEAVDRLPGGSPSPEGYCPPTGAATFSTRQPQHATPLPSLRPTQSSQPAKPRPVSARSFRDTRRQHRRTPSGISTGVPMTVHSVGSFRPSSAPASRRRRHGRQQLQLGDSGDDADSDGAVEAPDHHGRVIKCPRCRKRIRVPAMPAPQSDSGAAPASTTRNPRIPAAPPAKPAEATTSPADANAAGMVAVLTARERRELGELRDNVCRASAVVHRLMT